MSIVTDMNYLNTSITYRHPAVGVCPTSRWNVDIVKM